MRKNLKSIIEELNSTTVQNTEDESKEHKLNFILVADLKSAWSLFNLERGECMFCNCSSVGDRTEYKKHYKTYSRKFKKEELVFPELGILVFCFCTIHMRMRLVDQYLFILAGAVKGTLYQEKLEKTMDQIGIKFDYIPLRNKKGETTKGWKLPGYSAQQCKTIIDNLDKLNDCFPRFKTIFHKGTIPELKKRIRNTIPSIRIRSNVSSSELQKILFNHEETCKLDSKLDFREKFKNLWTTTFKMYNIISDGYSDEDTEAKDIYNKWDEKAKEVLKLFLEVHDAHRCRIYMHLLLCHGRDLFDIYGPLRWLSNQGCESANGRDTKTYFSFTSKGGGKLQDNNLSFAEKRDVRKSMSSKKVLIRPYTKLDKLSNIQTQKKNSKIKFYNGNCINFDNCGEKRQKLYEQTLEYLRNNEEGESVHEQLKDNTNYEDDPEDEYEEEYHQY